MQGVKADEAYFLCSAVQRLNFSALEAFLTRHNIIKRLKQIIYESESVGRRTLKGLLEALK
jgi:hypothetical protein